MTKKSILAIVLLFALLITARFSFTQEFRSSAESNSLTEKKILCNVSEDEDFEDNSIIIILNRQTGGINKRLDSNFFGGIEIKDIKDITYMTGDIAQRKYFDKENFRQILKLTLYEHSKENVIKTIKQLEKNDGILWAGPNYYAEMDAAPNDTNNGNLWGLTGQYGINASLAWDITTGSKKIQVGVIDSGIANHADLNANVVEGYDYYNGNSITDDDPTGHGTHVAGIIGACGNNGQGITGVNWNISLVPLQVVFLNNGKWKYSTAAIANAIIWATNRIPILNLSLGGFDPNTLDYPLLKYALNCYNGLLVCSAGNDYNDNDRIPRYPSQYADETNDEYQNLSNRIISVGALTKVGIRWSNSNYGAKSITLFAPGVNILSTVPKTISASGYSSWNGTSMAAPHVAGVAALLLSINENLTAAELKSIICKSVNKDNNLTKYCATGGFLNAYKALCSIAFKTNATGNIISGIDFVPKGELTIPETINEVTITGIGDSVFKDKTGLSRIFLPKSITSLGSSLFSNCCNLIDFSIPSTVTKIENYTFYGCSNLREITIPDNVVRIGEQAFGNCNGLEKITVDAGNTVYKSDGNCLLQKSDNVLLLGCKNSVIPACTTAIGAYAFKSCSGLTSLTIPAGVTDIRYNAFAYCRNLNSISVAGANAVYKSDGNCLIQKNDNSLILGCNSSVIPRYVESIAEYAFYGSGLSRINFAADGWLEKIGMQAFGACSKLTDVLIPRSVKTIEEQAFSYCSGLKTVAFEDGCGLSKIGDNAFSNCYSLTKIDIPRYVESIGYGAFFCCEELNDISFASGSYLRDIDGNTFYGCKKLTEIIIPHGVETIGDGAFLFCTSLKRVVLPGTLTYIDVCAFAACSNLTDIVLPPSLYEIGGSAFSECSSLTTIVLPAELCRLGGKAFWRSGLTGITIPASLTYIGFGAFEECENLATIYFEDMSSNYDTYLFDYTDSLKAIIVPDESTADTYRRNWEFAQDIIFAKNKVLNQNTGIIVDFGYIYDNYFVYNVFFNGFHSIYALDHNARLEFYLYENGRLIADGYSLHNLRLSSDKKYILEVSCSSSGTYLISSSAVPETPDFNIFDAVLISDADYNDPFFQGLFKSSCYSAAFFNVTTLTYDIIDQIRVQSPFSRIGIYAKSQDFYDYIHNDEELKTLLGDDLFFMSDSYILGYNIADIFIQDILDGDIWRLNEEIDNLNVIASSALAEDDSFAAGIYHRLGIFVKIFSTPQEVLEEISNNQSNNDYWLCIDGVDLCIDSILNSNTLNACIFGTKTDSNLASFNNYYLIEGNNIELWSE